MVGVPPSCELLGGFAIGARASLLWYHSANAKCQRALCTHPMPGYKQRKVKKKGSKGQGPGLTFVSNKQDATFV